MPCASNARTADEAAVRARGWPDSAEKYENIESIPGSVEKIQELLSDVAGLRKMMEAYDTERLKSGRLLIMLQEREPAYRGLEDRVAKSEQTILDQLTALRSRLKAPGDNRPATPVADNGIS